MKSVKDRGEQGGGRWVVVEERKTKGHKTRGAARQFGLREESRREGK